MEENQNTKGQLPNENSIPSAVQQNSTVDAILAYDRWVRFGNSAVEEREASLIQQFYPSLKRIVDPPIFEKMVNGIQICRPEGNPQLL